MPITLRSFYVVLPLLGSLFLNACGSFDKVSSRVAGVVSPYKIEIVQGNVVTREQVQVLKIGMPRAQVQAILGTSLLVSVFHAQRWDYVFSFKREGKGIESRKVTVFFADDKLAKIEADELPSETEFVAGLKGVKINGALPSLEASAESLQKFPPPAPRTPSSPSGAIPGGAASSNTVYPPLEAK